LESSFQFSVNRRWGNIRGIKIKIKTGNLFYTPLNYRFVQIRVEDALQYLKSLRNSLPIVWWKCICYHYVRKTRQVTRYRNGDAVPTTQVYYERVDSHSAGNVFIYDVCGFVFACIQAAREFEQQRTRFFNENETRDDYMEVNEPTIHKSEITMPKHSMPKQPMRIFRELQR
uniref:MBD domain-containing protein n=1 Tax=Angiostrongylus cantonensis TaxID=6313 RepID=A0A0K0DR81_ANGCA